MDPYQFIVLDRRWLLQEGSHPKRLSKGFCPIGHHGGYLKDGCSLLIKFREQGGPIRIDDKAKVRVIGNEIYLRSDTLAAFLMSSMEPPPPPWVFFFFEGTSTEARCVAGYWDQEFFAAVKAADATVRFEAFDLPPVTSTLVDSGRPLNSLFRIAASRDAELFAVHAERFVNAPHILTALFAHVLTIQTEDNIRFPVQVKKIAEQLRTLLTTSGAGVQIGEVKKSHLNLWAEAQDQRFGFLDGGVARIPALAGLEPTSLRVGIYSVRPGIIDPDEREQWRMKPFVLGDLVDRTRPTQERPDFKRFHEAARYTLEPLMALRHIKEFPDTRFMLLHGPLINQFVQYDEGTPNWIPFVSPEFLAEVDLHETAVLSAIADLPQDPNGKPMWNQFTAIYGAVMKMLDESSVPTAGVVERPRGRAVTNAVLERLKDNGLVNVAYVERVRKEIERYDITDDFLFGCVLRSGEYITPVVIQKNPLHRARERWQPVVRQFPQPNAFLLKTEEITFPFRVELNRAAVSEFDFLARFLFHTSRLLPRYAFPVGLDIVDKYVKVPDWISRGISAEMSAALLRKALKTGDPQVVTQIRLLLTQGPRDFFFRPSAR